MSGRDYPEESGLLPQPRLELGEDPQAPRPPAAANAWDVTFSYAIPEELRHQVAPGQLIEVPFRIGLLQGVIIGLSETPPPWNPQSVSKEKANQAIAEASEILAEINSHLAAV